MLKFLIDSGADVNLESDHGQTVLKHGLWEKITEPTYFRLRNDKQFEKDIGFDREPVLEEMRKEKKQKMKDKKRKKEKQEL